MGKLNQSQRQIVGENCVSASVANKKKNNVVVYCKDKDAGLRVKGVLSAAYPGYDFSKEEVGNGMSTWEWVTSIATLGGYNLTTGALNTWKVFTVKTHSKYNASELVKEIMDCIAEYTGYSDVDSSDYSGQGGGNEPRVVDTIKQSSGLNTYIIIGAAAIIIALLIWDRKKK